MKGRTLLDWLIAVRPWAFSASVVPVIAVTLFLAGRFAALDRANAVLSVLVIVLLHAGTDVLSDCRDHESGVDFDGSPNGVTWIRSGLFTVRELRRYAFALLAAGALCGLAVLARSSWSALWIGLVGLLVSFGYSFLKYRALGDLAVFLAFVALPAIGVGCVTTGRLLPETVLIALPPGLLTLSILNANNIRDVETDRAAGCRTIPIVLGRPFAKRVYLAFVLLPYLLVAAFILTGFVPYAALGTFLTLPLALACCRSLIRSDFAVLDRATAQLQLLFGLLFALAFPVARLGFWLQLSLASVLTGSLAVVSLMKRGNGGGDAAVTNRVLFFASEIVFGLVLAAVLWFVFWFGDGISRRLFGFAAGQIASIYALREGISPLFVGSLLLLLIGPAEELFWRGLVQRQLAARLGANAALLLTALAYALVHVASFNFMLVGAAAVCGFFWGALYRFFPRHLPALVVSHAVWDVAVFVLFPIV